MKPTPAGWPRIAPGVYYREAGAMIDWLCRAFGFEVRLKVVADNGRIEHSELRACEHLAARMLHAFGHDQHNDRSGIEWAHRCTVRGP